MSGLKQAGYSVWTQSKTGTSGVVLAKKGKRGKIRLVFILKKSITIPARPFLFLDDVDHAVISKLLSNSVKKDGE
jgi:hypothetical protein